MLSQYRVHETAIYAAEFDTLIDAGTFPDD
jgi:hypothetical protein